MKRLIKKGLNILGIEARKKHLATVESNGVAYYHTDDFNWEVYNTEYREEINHIQKSHTLKLKNGDYRLDGANLVNFAGILPLHPNHRLLYETLLLLKPASVVEVGCGGGDHLYNLKQLLPKCLVHGLDRSDKQLAFVVERSPELKNALQRYDATMPFSKKLPKVELAFTQAVIMHIQTGNAHLSALANLFAMASKQVVLMENWKQHAFLSDIKFLYKEGMIPWENIHFYFRRCPELNNKPHLMVVSSEPLDFEVLERDEQLINGMS